MQLKNIEINNLARDAQSARREVIDMIYAAGSGHSGGSLSCAEILTVLYGAYMNVDAKNPDWDERDRFVLSKACFRGIRACLNCAVWICLQVLWVLEYLLR